MSDSTTQPTPEEMNDAQWHELCEQVNTLFYNSYSDYTTDASDFTEPETKRDIMDLHPAIKAVQVSMPDSYTLYIKLYLTADDYTSVILNRDYCGEYWRE